MKMAIVIFLQVDVGKPGRMNDNYLKDERLYKVFHDRKVQTKIELNTNLVFIILFSKDIQNWR